MIYFDSAATTFQKPKSVSRGVAYALQNMSTPGRGHYREAEKAAETLFQCREAAAKLFHVSSEENVIFTSSATHGLNIAIKTLVQPGATVVVSGFEHNAVIRPLHMIPRVKIRVARGRVFDQKSILSAFFELVTPDVTAVICTHVSNVFGFVLPIYEIASICRYRGVPLIIDAAQSAGIYDLDFTKAGASFAAIPGHKGLYGPQGTGILLCGDILPLPLLAGGTGSMSADLNMPTFLPDRLEAGTHNVPGISGLLEGIRFVSSMGVDGISAYEEMLKERMLAGLSELPEVYVYAAEEGKTQSGVVSFVVKGKESEEIADYLAEKGIAVRGGLHCAPLAHESVGTLGTGTVRVSFSVFNTVSEINHFLLILKEFLSRKSP